ncbi:hypothetical protein [Kineothrix sp. MB12-C1]|uniref:hypothetical protein n=1 Tax=Kineothrix sp. MB12-C1 TaxID=3070215 RepID=UPI0027D238BC|nr:hypothetical protein [Kineothrix sp. MB12-C1]WMC92724.1 hypothetical protein RBB56_00075 [Kineothrix sp. MB12-C1]
MINGRNFDLAFVPLDQGSRKTLTEAAWIIFSLPYRSKTDFPLICICGRNTAISGKYKSTEIGSRFNENIIEISAPGQKEFELWNI